MIFIHLNDLQSNGCIEWDEIFQIQHRLRRKSFIYSHTVSFSLSTAFVTFLLLILQCNLLLASTLPSNAELASDLIVDRKNSTLDQTLIHSSTSTVSHQYLPLKLTVHNTTLSTRSTQRQIDSSSLFHDNNNNTTSLTSDHISSASFKHETLSGELRKDYLQSNINDSIIATTTNVSLVDTELTTKENSSIDSLGKVNTTSSVAMDWFNLDIDFHSVTSFLASGAIIFGGVVPYIPQYFEILRTKNSSGFSTYVCLNLIAANTLRIIFW